MTFAAADADGLVSKTCLRALERQHQYDPNLSLIAWVIRICRNLHIDDMRTRPNHLQLVDATDPDPSACQAIYDRLELNEVHRPIHRLPVEQREVLVLKGGGFSYDEIAARLGIAKGTVMSRLHRGRQTLIEMMNTKEAV